MRKIKLSKIGKIYAALYTDKFSASYKTNKLNEDGTVGKNDVAIFRANDVECRISFEKEDESKTKNEEYNPLANQIKIFCSADVDVIKGDRIVAQKLDDSGKIIQTYVGYANRPSKFVTHQEIIVQLEDGVNYGNVN